MYGEEKGDVLEDEEYRSLLGDHNSFAELGLCTGELGLACVEHLQPHVNT